MDAAPSTPVLIPGISKVTGALFLGIVMNWGLFGVLVVQVFIYYIHSSSKDAGRRWIQYLVYGIFVLEVIQTILCTVDGFHWFVFGWGDPDQLKKPLTSSIDSPFLDGIIALLVQSFFCWRICVLGKNSTAFKVYSSFLVLIALLQCAGGMASGILSVRLNDLSKIRHVETIPVAIWLSSSALVDTLIAISMCYLLLSQSRGLPSQDAVTKIVQITVETNALTAGVAILTLVLFIAFPDENYFICPPYILGKLYSNTLLVIFNNRNSYKSRSALVYSSGTNPTRRQSDAIIAMPKLDLPRQPQNVVVNVHQATITNLDDEDHYARSLPSDGDSHGKFPHGADDASMV